MRFFSVLLLLIATSANAESIEMIWESPTTRTDSTPINGALDYLIYKNGEIVATVGNNNHSLDAISGESLCVAARETVSGVQAISERVCAIIPAFPNKPENLRFQIVFSYGVEI